MRLIIEEKCDGGHGPGHRITAEDRVKSGVLRDDEKDPEDSRRAGSQQGDEHWPEGLSRPPDRSCVHLSNRVKAIQWRKKVHDPAGFKGDVEVRRIDEQASQRNASEK